MKDLVLGQESTGPVMLIFTRDLKKVGHGGNESSLPCQWQDIEILMFLTAANIDIMVTLGDEVEVNMVDVVPKLSSLDIGLGGF